MCQFLIYIVNIYFHPLILLIFVCSELRDATSTSGFSVPAQWCKKLQSQPLQGEVLMSSYINYTQNGGRILVIVTQILVVITMRCLVQHNFLYYYQNVPSVYCLLYFLYYLCHISSSLHNLTTVSYILLAKLFPSQFLY